MRRRNVVTAWRLVGLVTSVVLVASGAGCSGKPFRKKPWLMTERDAACCVREALESESADARRDAIVQVGQSRYADHDMVVKACALIACGDRSVSVRTAALLVVAESLRSDAAATLLKVLSEDAGDADVRVQTQALHGLYYLRLHGAVGADVQDAVVESASRLLGSGGSRDVRIAAARVLGYYDREVGVRALIAALGQRDFGVVYHADHSLMRLTGERFHHDRDAWQSWLASTEAPFAKRGQLDATLDPPVKASWWQKMSESMRRTAASFRARGKEAG